MTESMVSISSPFCDEEIVVSNEIPLVILTELLSFKFPEKVKFADPSADFPFVTIYETVITLPWVGFLPKISSPNRISYFSSSISWSKNNLDVLSTFKIFSYNVYVSVVEFVTLTRIVVVSTPELGITNLWFDWL